MQGNWHWASLLPVPTWCIECIAANTWKGFHTPDSCGQWCSPSYICQLPNPWHWRNAPRLPRSCPDLQRWEHQRHWNWNVWWKHCSLKLDTTHHSSFRKWTLRRPNNENYHLDQRWHCSTDPLWCHPSNIPSSQRVDSLRQVAVLATLNVPLEHVGESLGVLKSLGFVLGFVFNQAASTSKQPFSPSQFENVKFSNILAPYCSKSFLFSLLGI